MRRLLYPVAAILVRVMNALTRAEHVHAERLERQPQYILTFWHMHLLTMLYSRFRRPIHVMSSQSKDGEISAQVFRYYDVGVVRGSSSKGASAALREFVRKAKGGSNLVFTPDGPRGPARVAKPGVIFAAQMSGLPIVPVVFAAKKKKLLGSWDRMIVPLPFTKAVYLYGEPIFVPREGDVEEYRERVERALNELTDEAERLVEEKKR